MKRFFTYQKWTPFISFILPKIVTLFSLPSRSSLILDLPDSEWRFSWVPLLERGAHVFSGNTGYKSSNFLHLLSSPRFIPEGLHSPNTIQYKFEMGFTLFHSCL